MWSPVPLQLALLVPLAWCKPALAPTSRDVDGGRSKIAPKVFIFSMFDAEADVWYNIPEFNLLAHNISVPGFSPLFPQAHCTSSGTICQATFGEGEINAASTISSLLYSPQFDLTKTYFLIGGIAGINPKLGTLGSVTFARYAVQVDLQFEIDGREIPAGFNTGYVPQGSRNPDQYPQSIYGTEVFEVNDALRQVAYEFAKTAELVDTPEAKAYRANYAGVEAFAAAANPPSVVLCDTATADTFWAGTLLAEAFENTTRLWTNGTGVYCSTQQEDNATLEVLMRGDISGLVDFSRIIIMRTGSDIDRPFPGQTSAEGLFADQGGFLVSVENIYVAGVKVVQGIMNGWDSKFSAGVKPANYIGDIFGSLGGQPDFGPGSIFGGQQAPSTRRSLMRKRNSRR
ncbi:purine nucleoside [Moniliophthora roreri MCA 2997]|uniref:Purine nucleoside n=2 Tax=Moniliophthora roreri TaxID=221103 RepID=V2XZX9_MONRO|nr:purine nucleoside [Moniliophthora roreri MCA 2997]KAI3622259.1 purine nucleoside [Moniliophthora roreri]